jgi:lactam utilization protein B/allophanate hydrolase subunit 2
MKINCDIGERGATHPVDCELMQYVDIANIACGGHAGDSNSVAAFRSLANQHGCAVSAHLSYPDSDNFGRISMELSPEKLYQALDQQYAMMPDIKLVKLHGALYNDCCINSAKAECLVVWLKQNKIEELIAPANSVIAKLCEAAGISVMSEAFAERRYDYDPVTERLTLVSRTKPYASIHELDLALDHCRGIINDGTVNAYVGADRKFVPVTAETICIHSDSDIALELVRALKELLKNNQTQPYKILDHGTCELITMPQYGQQDIGISPGGAMDRFACKCGCLAVNCAIGAPALEILLPTKLQFTKSTRCIMTGAPRENIKMTSPDGKVKVITHRKSFTATPGDILSMGGSALGCRTYLCWNDANTHHKSLPPFSEMCTWADPEERIRVTRGPEYHQLINPDQFLDNSWMTTPQMSRMGMRLQNRMADLSLKSNTMISGPVADGTVQLTPESPIILLRHRQTVGGYPRIFNVVEVDIDRLVQLPSNRLINFREIDISEAVNLLKQQRQALESLKN